MNVNRNIININEIKEYRNDLIHHFPQLESFINIQIYHYLLRDASIKNIYFYKYKLNKTSMDQTIIKKGGPYHKVILSADLKNQILKILNFLKLDDYSQKYSKKSFEEVSFLLNVFEAKQKEYIFKDGYKIVLLQNKKTLKKEAFKMRNCLASYKLQPKCFIYALKDEYGNSIVNLEIENGLYITHLFEYANRIVTPQNKKYINEFALKKNLKIKNFHISQIFNQAGVTFLSGLYTLFLIINKDNFFTHMSIKDPEIQKVIIYLLIAFTTHQFTNLYLKLKNN